MEYGTPIRLTNEERDYLRRLDEAIWDRSKDRFGSTHSFEKETPLSEEDAERVIALIYDKCLPCVLCSGPYGNLSVRIYDHSDDMAVCPEYVASFGERHFQASKGAAWGKRFDFFAEFTHSQRNREILTFYNMPLPDSKERYAY